MKRYVKSSTSNGSYIGGKLSDVDDYGLYEDDDTYYATLTARSETQSDYIATFANNYIIYRPDDPNWTFDLSLDSVMVFWDLTESMAIKEGVDVVAYDDHIDVIAYYGSDEEVAHLYPVSDGKVRELTKLIDNSDFDYSTTIEMEIAQYTYGGAPVEYILKSWA